MGAVAILAEMLDLMRQQAEAVVTGDHRALVDGAARHEGLLSDLRQAEHDAPPDQLRALVVEINREKQKLHSLLDSESARVDFLLRLILGGGKPQAGGYPTGHWEPGGLSRRLNHRT